MDGVGRGRGEGAGRWPPSAALFQVGGQEQPRGQEVQVPVADLHLPLALQVGTCQGDKWGQKGRKARAGVHRGAVSWAGPAGPEVAASGHVGSGPPGSPGPRTGSPDNSFLSLSLIPWLDGCGPTPKLAPTSSYRPSCSLSPAPPAPCLEEAPNPLCSGCLLAPIERHPGPAPVP